MKLKKAIGAVIVAIALIAGFRIWSDKPYCTVEYLDSLTVKGKQNPFVYTMSKIIAQRRDLKGNDPYKMYVYAHDPDGIESVRLAVNGTEIPATIEDPNTFESELPGDTEIGLHHYVLTVTDKKGNTGRAESFIKVSNVGAGFGI